MKTAPRRGARPSSYYYWKSGLLDVIAAEPGANVGHAVAVVVQRGEKVAVVADVGFAGDGGFLAQRLAIVLQGLRERGAGGRRIAEAALGRGELERDVARGAIVFGGNELRQHLFQRGDELPVDAGFAGYERNITVQDHHDQDDGPLYKVEHCCSPQLVSMSPDVHRSSLLGIRRC